MKKIVMRNIITMLSLTLMTASTYAQVGNQGSMNATIHKTFSIEKDGTEIQYNVKVMEHRRYPMKWNKTDKGDINQGHKYEAAKVTKLIAIDKNNDNQYEQYFVLKYRKSISDEFQVVPTKGGFAVKVDDKTLKLIEKEGIYFINNKDEDFFSIEEFRELG
ncbi:hypothetical protein [Flagellimonas meridianipacifica]|uniref:GLPGLI family protein n=1 Tax=Flagellimonas meridianipacifica TaxID=1080225 RepID=A0A2T0M828_9FLAO|nr:hypothetical protein [Allomuricauda pacifica]PRX53625.1 hypothetical protein CLV81_2010 [Allomuricauda pacifica]